MKLLHLIGASMVALAVPALAAQSATSVTSSKSNSSFKSSGPVAADAQPAEATTVNGSKSNSDLRTGGPVAADSPPAEVTTVNASKSNTFKIDPSDPDGERKCAAQGGTLSRERDGTMVCTIPAPACPVCPN